MWVKFSGRSTSKSLNLRTKLRLAGVRQVTAYSELETGAEVRDDHKAWLDDLSREYNQAYTQTEKPEVLLPSFCGLIYLTSEPAARAHGARCKACLQKRSSLVSESVKVIGTIPGLTGMSLNGLLSSLKLKRDEALEIASAFDSVIQALESKERLDRELAAIKAQQEEHRKVLSLFLKDAKQI